MHFIFVPLLFIIPFTFIVVVAAAATTTHEKLWLNKELPIQQRVNALMKTLTLQQKIAQTFATHTDANTILKNLKTGIGAAKYMGFNGKKGGGGAAQN